MYLFYIKNKFLYLFLVGFFFNKNSVRNCKYFIIVKFAYIENQLKKAQILFF